MPEGASIVTKAYDLALWLLPRVTVAIYLSHYTTARTARHAPALPAPSARRNTPPPVRQARKRPSPDGSCAKNVSWHGDWASCHNTRHDRRSGRDGDAP